MSQQEEPKSNVAAPTSEPVDEPPARKHLGKNFASLLAQKKPQKTPELVT